MVVDFKAWFENPLKREESALAAPSALSRRREATIFRHIQASKLSQNIESDK